MVAVITPNFSIDISGMMALLLGWIQVSMLPSLVSTLLTLTGGKNLLLMLSISAFSVQFSCFNVPSSVVWAQEFNKLWVVVVDVDMDEDVPDVVVIVWEDNEVVADDSLDVSVEILIVIDDDVPDGVGVGDVGEVVAVESFVVKVVVIVEIFSVVLVFGNSVDTLFNVELIKFSVSSIMFPIFSSSPWHKHFPVNNMRSKMIDFIVKEMDKIIFRI